MDITTGSTGPYDIYINDTDDYYWRGRAKFSYKASYIFSQWSETSSFSVLGIGTPVLISPINSAIVVDSTPRLSWEEVTGADGYIVQASRSTSSSINELFETIIVIGKTTTVLSAYTDRPMYRTRIMVIPIAVNFINRDFLIIFIYTLLY